MTIRKLTPVLLALAMAAGLTALQSKKEKQEELGKRSVQGAVRDQTESPANGAVVQLKNTKTLQIRSYLTKEDGVFRFNGLSKDVDYELKAERDGMVSATKTLSVFDDRPLATINLKLESKK